MFEFFTHAARQIVVQCQAVSRERQDGFIAPEHILVALAGDTQGVAGAALERVGVTRQSALEAAERRLGSGNRSDGHLIPFTPEAKRTLEVALRMRMDLADEEVDTEHLLLSLARTDVHVAYGLLAEVGVSSEAVHAAVGEVRPAVAGAVAALRPARPPRASTVVPAARRAVPPLVDFDLAGVHFAATRGEGAELSTLLDSGHLLIGMAAAADSVAGRALQSLGVDPQAVRGAVERVRAADG